MSNGFFEANASVFWFDLFATIVLDLGPFADMDVLDCTGITDSKRFGYDNLAKISALLRAAFYLGV